MIRPDAPAVRRFDPRPREEATSARTRRTHRLWRFDPRPREEATAGRRTGRGTPRCFDPRPREEATGSAPFGPRSIVRKAGCVPVHSTTLAAVVAPNSRAPPCRGAGRDRQGLRLVQHDHTLRQVVQLAAARGAVREQALEELDRRRHDDRAFPSSRGASRKSPPRRGPRRSDRATAPPRPPPNRSSRGVRGNRPLARERLAKHLRGLLDDGGERHDIDDPPQPCRMACSSAKDSEAGSCRRRSAP